MQSAGGGTRLAQVRRDWINADRANTVAGWIASSNRPRQRTGIHRQIPVTKLIRLLVTRR